MKLFFSILFLISIILGCVMFRHVYNSRTRYSAKTLATMGFSALLADALCLMVMLIDDTDSLYLVFVAYFICYGIFVQAFCMFTISYTLKKEIKYYKLPFTYLNLIFFIHLLFSIKEKTMLIISTVTIGHTNFAFCYGTGIFYLFNLIVLLEILLSVFLYTKSAVKSANIYRLRYIVLDGLSMLILLLSSLSYTFRWPEVIRCLFLVPSMLFLVYITVYYSQHVLKDSTLLFAADKLSDGLILYDEDDMLIYINDASKSLLTDEQLLEFNSHEPFKAWSMELSDVEGVLMKKVPISGHDDRFQYFSIEKHIFTENDYYIGTCYTLRDMTDTIERISDMEHANSELERAAHMKSDFLANMSHEIRTPMNAVIGMAEMALREDMTDQARDYIAQIKSSGRNLLNIINDILDFSKIESGKMEIIPDTYEPLSEFNDVANTLINRIGDKDIELTLEENPLMPAKLEGDVMRIRQILINLANNAIKFTSHGRVQIICDFRPLTEDTIMTEFHVVDTGQGIKPEDLKKLFVSFQQVDSKRNRNVEGTGLGLAISKNLVEVMGGSIGVDSEYGKGSDFHFELPQKIIDATPSITVQSSGNIFAFGMFRKKYLARRFFIDTNRMHVFSALLKSYDQFDYTCETYRDMLPEKDKYIFFEEYDYEENVKPILLKHKDFIGVMLAEYSSAFKPDLPNLRMVKKPFSTMAIARALNNQDLQIDSESGQAFEIDFTAPDAQVLIVDDNQVNLTVAEGLLNPLKMKVYTAISGAAAIDLMQDHKFDLIFMDHMMPGMDGVETTHVIRRMFPEFENVPIIALTANAINGAKEYFLREGMNDFIPKPIEVRDILIKTQQWLPPEKIQKSMQVISIDTAAESELSIPGLNTSDAIRMIGSEELYLKILNEYFKNIQKNHKEILDAFDSGDWDSYTIKVHALKSSSKQIGAMDLSQKAAALEAAGHSSDTDFIKANSAEALEMYLTLADILAPYCDSPSADKAKEAYDPAAVKELLGKMITACEDLDMDVMEETTSGLDSYSYPEEIEKMISDLKDNAEIMDVDTCSEIANKLLDII